MKFYSVDEDDEWWGKDCFSNTILVHLSNSSDAYENQEEGIWANYQFNINEILDECLSTELDRVVGVSLQGHHYLIDYIKLTSEEDDQLIEQVIDEFTFSGSPFDNGWENNLPQSPGYALLEDDELGHSCLMISSATILSVSEGADLQEKNFTLSLGGSIQGKVMDKVNGSPVPGIKMVVTEVTAPLEDYEGYYWYPGADWSEAVSDSNGCYTVNGLLPGTYKVEAYDPDNYYETTIYEDIPSGKQNSIILSKDLSTFTITNSTLLLEFMYKDKFAFRIDFEKSDGNTQGVIFQTDDDDVYIWPDEGAEDVSLSIFHIELDTETGYYEEDEDRTSENQWTSFKLDTVAFNIIQGLDLDLNRIKKVYLAETQYRIASIKFIREGEEDQEVEDFNFEDSVENHGWIILNPEITSLRMIEDPLLERRVLESLPAKPVNVEERETTTEINFHLRGGNKITGRVTDAKDDTPLTGIQVITYYHPNHYYGYYYPIGWENG